MKSLYFFFLDKIRQKKVIGNVLHRKLAFLDHKNMGLVYGFTQNYEICLFHLFRENTPKNVFGNVLDRKLAFLDYKNMD